MRTFESIPDASVGMEKLFLPLLLVLFALAVEVGAWAGVDSLAFGVVTLRRMLERRRAFDRAELGVVTVEATGVGAVPVEGGIV